MRSIHIIKLLLTIGLCLVIAVSFAQPGSAVKKAQKAYDQANSALASNKLSEAKDLLQIAIQEDPKFATAYQQLADILRKEEEFATAIPYYQKVLELDPGLTSLTHFGLGSSYLFTGQYNDALNHFTTYKKSLKPNSSSIQSVNKYIADCEFALAHPEKNKGVQLTRLSSAINSSHDEYFPKLTANNQMIIFTRKENNQENFYSSKKVDQEWSIAEKLPEPINSTAYNEGAHCISLDGKQLYFTGCNRPDGMGSCDLYVSNNVSGQWTKPINLGSSINSKGWEAQPAISADGNTLYFVSNRAGGFGANDIWMSTRNTDGTWAKAVNLGDQVNSPYDEGAPYIHGDNKTLYFSSNGWPGFGKNDIFKSEQLESGQWSKAKNLGRPINDHLDQRSFNINLDGKIGYLASQDSLRNWDIYTAHLPQELTASPVAFLEGTILEQNTNIPLSASVRVTETKNNNQVFEALSDRHEGEFLVVLPVGGNYALHVQKEGYLFHSKQYDLMNNSSSATTFQDSIFLAPIQSGSVSILRNIYFNSNEFQILPDSEADLNQLLEFLRLNSKIRIVIEGHTDNSGNPQNNQLLSENRASEVAKYLIEKGVTKERIQTHGYGDTKPIDRNDTESGKQANRRTSFRIL